MVSDSRQHFNLIEKDIMSSSAWKMKPGKFRNDYPDSKLAYLSSNKIVVKIKLLSDR